MRLSPSAGLPLGWMSWLAPDGATEGSAVLSTRAVDPLYRRAPAPQPAPGFSAAAPIQLR
jgi:hypothetical protein